MPKNNKSLKPLLALVFINRLFINANYMGAFEGNKIHTILKKTRQNKYLAFFKLIELKPHGYLDIVISTLLFNHCWLTSYGMEEPKKAVVILLSAIP